jgi:hypothetical protein
MNMDTNHISKVRYFKTTFGYIFKNLDFKDLNLVNKDY